MSTSPAPTSPVRRFGVLFGAIAAVMCLFTSCEDSDSSSVSSPSSIHIREDNNYYSGDNHHNWNAPGGEVRVTLEVDDFHHGDMRVRVFDSRGVKIYDEFYYSFDWYYHFDGRYYDVGFTAPGASGNWTIVLDYHDFTGEVDLLLEDLDFVAPEPPVPPADGDSALLVDTFGTDGRATYIPDATRGRRVVVDSTGRSIVVGAVVTPNGDRSLGAWRYLANGTVDITFGTGGVFTYNGADASAGFDVTVDAMDRVLLSGWRADEDDDTDLLLLRLTTAGVLDVGFGTDGAVTFDDGVDDIGFAVEIDGADNIVLAGASHETMTGAGNMLALRYLSNGILDTNFGTGGVFRSADMSDRGFDLELDSLGRVVIAGVQGDAMAVWRLTGTGALDATFGTAGVFTESVVGEMHITRSLAIKADDTIATTGVVISDSGTDPAELAIWRIDDDGVAMGAFDTDGLARYEYGSGWAVGTDIAFHASGILVTGVTRNLGINADASATLWRFAESGAPDGTLLDADASGASRFDERSGTLATGASSMAPTASGTIIVTGGVADRSSSATDLLVWELQL